MNQRKVNSIKSRIRRLASTECASFTGKDGCHVSACGRCVLTYETDSTPGNVCPYFMRAVLPTADGQLKEDYLDWFPDDYPLKLKKVVANDQCENCGQSIIKHSNAQKYCDKCKTAIRREQERLRQKERRLNAIRN